MIVSTIAGPRPQSAELRARKDVILTGPFKAPHTRSFTMLLSEFEPTTEPPDAGLTDRFALRVHGPTLDYLIDLPRGKTTIGSSPRCNIRIQEPGVQPLHCLIFGEGHRLTVRRWAADALLNGQQFEESPLAVGDHLSLGPVDLEVVVEQAEEPVESCHDAGRWTTSIDEPTPEPAAVSWGKDTIHHTTVWIGEEEGEDAQAPSEHAEETFLSSVESTIEATAEFATPMEVETLAKVVPADAAREVFRQLQAANGNSRSRSRKLLAALRTSREANQALSDQVIGLSNAKDELVAEHTALARERNLLREQLTTAEERYAEWDHQSNQWEELRKVWDAARVGWDHEKAIWDHDRSEWSRQAGEWEVRLAGYVSRIEELEAQLADAQANAHEPSHAQPKNRHADAPAAPPTSAETAQECSPTLEPQPEAWVSALPRDEQSPEPVTPTEPETSEAQIPAWEPTAPAEPPAWDRQSPTWESEPPSWEDHGPLPGEEAPSWDDHNRQPDREFPAEPQKPETDAEPAIEQTAAPIAPSTAATVATPIVPPEATESESPPASDQPRTVSYIDRFAHMFADELTVEPAPASPAAPPAVADPVAGKPRNGPVIRADGSAPATTVGEVEESIEDYMAKLLQRVRGERPYVAGSQAPPAAKPQQDATASPPQFSPPDPTALPPAIAAQEAVSATNETRKSLDERVPDLSDLIRKAPVIGQPTNLKALRALANETARHAIGVHASKKHRRDAMSKFVVASLAGMTSVWLMMLAPSWRDLQFISACVGLLIAAYWAGQVYSNLVEMQRAGDYDRPEAEDDFDDLKVEG